MSKIINATNEDIVRISSTEIKDMMEIREHGNLIKKIEKHTEILKNFTDVKINVSDLWIEGTYKDSTGRTLKDYKISKKGCEFLAHKTTGEKGDLFTIKYMERFEEMEKTLSNPYKELSKELQAIFMLDKKQQETSKKVDYLYNTMTIDYSQQEELRMLANRTIIELLGGKKTEAYKRLKNRMFQEMWRSYKKNFKVNSYKNTATKDFDAGYEFIETWDPDELLGLAIDGLNNQIVFA